MMVNRFLCEKIVLKIVNETVYNVVIGYWFAHKYKRKVN